MTSPQLASIVDVLPAEVLFIVGEYLDLYDRLQFSRTCRYTQKLFNIDQKKELNALSDEEIIEYYHQASLHLADYWVCDSCARLHRVNELDLPFGEFSQHWPACQEHLSRFMGPISRFYAPREMHKQLAFKYSMPRFKDVHQDYLWELMKPRMLAMPGGRLWYQQEHKIVEGQFLVRATTIMCFEGSVWDYMLLHGTGLCSHARVEQVDWAHPPLDMTSTEPRKRLSVKLAGTD